MAPRNPDALSRLLSLVLFIGFVSHVAGLGGELATYNLPQNWGSATAASASWQRQDFCKQYDRFSAGEIELRDALSGMHINTFIGNGDYFNYNSASGIQNDPGLVGEIMDAVAKSANFTWRNSFAVYSYSYPALFNLTWTDFLLRGVEDFDIIADYYVSTVARMEQGVAFIKPWYDSSMILIDQLDPPAPNQINYTNWAKPFEPAVWGLILVTVLLSALVYQLVEYLNGEREDRSLFQWFSDNLYLSSLNSTQNFEYAPNSVAGRLFGVSMGIWALVVTATYTANLASLFVEDQKAALKVDSIEQAIVLGIPICSWGLTAHEDFVRKKYKNAIVVPRESELDVFRSLRRGDCGLAVATKDSWQSLALKKEFNPDCDLEWVGRAVKAMSAGFALKADTGDRCTGFIRDVFNLHLTEFIEDGELDIAWAKHRSKTQDIDCHGKDAYGASGLSLHAGRRRHLQVDTTDTSMSQSFVMSRRLKGGSNSAAAATVSGAGKTALSVDQMLGTFVLHWAAMAFAVVLSFIAAYYDKWEKQSLEARNLRRSRKVNRAHGPVIGIPPPVNTYVITNNENKGPVCDDFQQEQAAPRTMLQRTPSTSAIRAHRQVRKTCSERSLRAAHMSDSSREEHTLHHRGANQNNQGVSLEDELAAGAQEHQGSVQQPMRLRTTYQSDSGNVEDRIYALDNKLEMLLSLVQRQSHCIDRQEQHIQELKDHYMCSSKAPS